MIHLLIKRRLRQWEKDERGVMSLEASLVLPLICSVIFIMMLCAVYMYQLIVVQYISQTTVERAAFIWDQHKRDFSSGKIISPNEYSIYQSDLLYQFAAKLVQLDYYAHRTTITVTDGMHPPSSDHSAEAIHASLIDAKLHQAADYSFSGTIKLTGEVSFNPISLLPSVEASLQQTVSPLIWNQQQLFPAPKYNAQSKIVSPTSFIRGIDLLRYYTKKLSHYSSSEKNEWKQRGGKAVKAFSSKEE